MNRRQLLQAVKERGLPAKPHQFLYWLDTYAPEPARDTRGNRIFTKKHLEEFVVFVKRRQAAAALGA